MASIGSASGGKVTASIRVVCVINLQKLEEILNFAWTFSIAMDMSTHMSTSYLDIRLRIFYCSEVHTFHLLAIPMYSAHTGDAIFCHTCKALDVLFPSWRNIILSITTDGEPNFRRTKTNGRT